MADSFADAEAAGPTDAETEPFADAETDRFSAWLRERCGDRWADATRHRFVEEYRDGALGDETFRRYLIDDYAFLESGARVTALAASQAHEMAEMNRLAAQLDVLTGGENDYFRRAFDALDVPEAARTDPDLHPTTRAFLDFMARVALDGRYEETLATVAAAEWVYLEWCRYAAEGTVERWYLEEWLEIHVIEDFEDYVSWLCGQLDAYGPRLSARGQERVADRFARTVDLEARFFDAAYDAR